MEILFFLSIIGLFVIGLSAILGAIKLSKINKLKNDVQGMINKIEKYHYAFTPQVYGLLTKELFELQYDINNYEIRSIYKSNKEDRKEKYYVKFHDLERRVDMINGRIEEYEFLFGNI